MVALELPASVESPLLLLGDCLDVLARLPAESIDVVITDPPAGIAMMGKAWDSFAGYEPRTSRGIDVAARLEGLLERLAVGFVAFLADVWSEVDRVLKPGGLVCAWALPKTADLAGLALRSVGWTIADSLLHLFGEGMSKTGCLGKSIDAMLGAEREVVGPNPDAKRGSQRSIAGTQTSTSVERNADITAPATDEAKRWTDGCTPSGLAPGHEQWLLARKPSRLIYAQQVLTHGTGALNIGVCRVPRGEGEAGTRCTNRDAAGACRGHRNAGVSTSGETFHGPDTSPAGSWPKNVVLSEGGKSCPVAELDRQSGASRGASRFFTRLDPGYRYEAKNSDRRAGMRSDIRNEHPTPKSLELMRWLVALLAAKAEHTGGLPAIVLDPFLGSGTTGVACVAEQVRFIGIERDEASFTVARARILAAIGSPEAAAEANAFAPVGGQLGLL